MNSPVFYEFEKKKIFHFVVLLSNIRKNYKKKFVKIYNEIRGGERIFLGGGEVRRGGGGVTNIFSAGGGGGGVKPLRWGTQIFERVIQPLFMLCV